MAVDHDLHRRHLLARQRTVLSLVGLVSWLSLLLCVSLTSSWSAADEPVFPDAEWRDATPAAMGVDPQALEKAIAFLDSNAGSNGVSQLFIVRHGRVIKKGPAVDSVHGVWSMTKSFASTVLGLLIDDGKCSLDTLAKRRVPDLEAGFGSVSLRHFATMTSGYRARGDEPRGSYSHGPSTTPFEPDVDPLFSPPGTRYAYWDSAMNKFGQVLTRIAGEPIADLFRRRIAEPIGMDPRAWGWGDFGKIDGLTVHGGAGNNGKDVRISARQIARLGLLFLHRGKWKNRQLLPAAWVDDATSPQVPVSLPLGHEESGIDGRGVYGFNWWTNGLMPDGRRKWPGAPLGTFSASGYNNNDLFVIPAWDMVIVRLGLDERDRKISDVAYGDFLEKVGEAIREGATLSLQREGWKARSPRQDIAPRSWLDSKVLYHGVPTLGLEGGGNGAVHGWWTRRVGVEAGRDIRFETKFSARDVEEPGRSVLARILWRDGDGQQVQRAEYPGTLLDEDGEEWRTIRGVYRVPPGTVTADLELVYRWDGDGVVHFAATSLERTAKPQPRRVRLAAIHHRPRGSSGPAANVEAFCKLIARAARLEADIVCLPEGITVVGTGKKYADVSEPIPGPTSRRLGEAARQHGLYVVAGIYEREGKVIYNTAVVMDPEGELLGKYRKVCLPREEIQGGITPGDALPVFDTSFGRIGLMICWDVFFPEPARVLAQKGAEVIFLPIWGGNLTLARARAIENQVYLVSATYDMKTAVFDKEGEIMEEGSDEEPVIVVEVDLAERKLWRWLGDFRARIPREMPTFRSLPRNSK